MTADSTTADQLLAAARGGDGQALGRLFSLYRNYLYFLARTQADMLYQGLLSPSDVVQDTFLLAHQRFDEFRGATEQELLGWLRRILIRCLSNQQRKQRTQKRDRHREVSLNTLTAAVDKSADRLQSVLVSQISSPSAQAQRRETVATVADRLAELPDHYREIIVLRHLEGVAFGEIARRLGKSESAVRALWLRALDHLRRIAPTENRTNQS
jgi:RNA polymerase sigma-70 factor (ECF subfamily)